MSQSLRIIFMGTPDFAVASFRRLLEEGRNVVAVVTAPDRPSGRGQRLYESPVKKAALAAGIPVLQPEKLRDPAFLDALQQIKADLQVIVAFRMLPEVVWSMPRKGTFNLHASLLPHYRGAAPINWAIINGEMQTGVTTFFIEKDIDTGQMIFQEPEPIYPTDTAGTLHDRLMQKGADLVLKTVRAIEENHYSRIPQPTAGVLKLAPKIHRETCKIDWSQSSEMIRNFVRGLAPYPTAWTVLNGKLFKIFRVCLTLNEEDAPPGEYRTDNKKYLHIRTVDGWVSVEELQAEGKREMTVEAYFRGNKL